MTIHTAHWYDDPRDEDRDAPDAPGASEARDAPPEQRPPRLDEVGIWIGHDLRWEHLLEVARELGPDPRFEDLADHDLEVRLRSQAAEVAASTCRYLELLAELVVRGIWAEQGARTPAQWLSWAIGLGPSTAREHVRIALRLRDLPQIHGRFAAGTLSYSKVRALTRVATPELEDLLLEWADHATGGELEQVVRGWRRSRRGLAREFAESVQHENVTHRIDDDGMMVIVIRAMPERGAEILDKIHRLVQLEEAASAEAAEADPATLPMDELAGIAVEDADPATDGDAAEELEAADTLMDGPLDRTPHSPDRGTRMVDAVLDALTVAGEADPGDATGADRHTLVLQVPADALAGGDDPRPIHPVEGARGRLPSMSAATLRRLACDGGIVVAVTDEHGCPIDVGRRHRRLTAALRRALRLRDRSCRFPGCTTTRHLHAHHVVFWSDGGPTDLANLVLLCSYHHRVVHDAGWSVTGDGTGRFTFAPPGADPLPRSLSLPGASAEAVTDRIATEALRDPASLQPVYWDGPGSVDYDMAVAVLHQELSRVLPEPAMAA